MMELERDPTFRMYDIYDLTKDEIRERTLEKVKTCPFYLTFGPPVVPH
jgi:acyl-CoA oxidase